MRTYRNPRSLAGRWKFRLDPEGRGDFGEPDASIASWQREVTWFDREHDDSAWDEIAVPACWQTAGLPVQRHRLVSEPLRTTRPTTPTTSSGSCSRAWTTSPTRG